MKRLLPYLTILSAMVATALLPGCQRDDFGDCDCGVPGTLFPNMDIGDVRALYDGTPSIVNGDVILAGHVTANDISGNFYRTFVIDDGTGAIEVRAGLYDLKNLFPLGRYVAVRAAGLTVSDYNGVLQIGLAPAGGSALPEYFGHKAILDRYVHRGAEMTTPVPQEVAVTQLSAVLCGRLVTVSGLRLKAGEPGEWASQDTYTSYSTRLFTDGEGREVGVVTSKYADFAGMTIPSGEISVTGILTKEKTGQTYAIKMRSINDVVGN